MDGNNDSHDGSSHSHVGHALGDLVRRILPHRSHPQEASDVHPQDAHIQDATLGLPPHEQNTPSVSPLQSSGLVEAVAGTVNAQDSFVSTN